MKQDWLEKSISLGRLHRRYFVLFQYGGCFTARADAAVCILQYPVLIYRCAFDAAGVLCYFRTDEDCQNALGSEELAPTPEKGSGAAKWLSCCLQLHVRDDLCRRNELRKSGQRLHSVGEDRSDAHCLLR